MDALPCTLLPYAGQDQVAHFLVYPDKAVFVLCYTGNCRNIPLVSVSLTGAPAISLTGAQPLIFPRKEVKAHGTQRLIEGHYEPGEKVVVVDDILITGNSVMQGAEKLQSVGLEVRDIVVFIDLPGVKDKLQAHGYRGHAVLTLAEIAVSLTRFLFTHPVVRQQATTWVGGSVNDRERSHIPHGSAAITLAERIDDRQFQLLI